jgi:O-acetyl-ADP-ribose deacetylase (regulator of RNase III)
MLTSEKRVFRINDKEIGIVFDDITDLAADVIVSSDDNHLTMAGGVSRSILQAGGEVIWEEARQFVPATVGSAVTTSAGQLQAKHIVHAIVIDYDAWRWPDVEIVRKATQACLREADRLECKSVAMPAIATGAGGMASQVTAEVIISEVFEFIGKAQHVQSVVIVLNRQDTLFDFLAASIEKRVRSEYAGQLEGLEREKQRLLAELRQNSPYRDLPFPIAVTRRITETHNNYHSRYTSAMECAECIVKYCAVLVLADHANHDPSIKPKLAQTFRRPVTFGSWLKQMEDSLKALRTQKMASVVAQIGDLFLGKNPGYVAQFVDERNKLYGHGATLMEDAYRPQFDALIARIDELLEHLRFLNEFPLVVIDQIDLLPDGYVYQAYRLAGDNIIFQRERYEFEQLRLARDGLYVFDIANSRALCLHPFAVFETCPFCNVQETFFLEKHGPDGDAYHTYRANHRITTRKHAHSWQ